MSTYRWLLVVVLLAAGSINAGCSGCSDSSGTMEGDADVLPDADVSTDQEQPDEVAPPDEVEPPDEVAPPDEVEQPDEVAQPDEDAYVPDPQVSFCIQTAQGDCMTGDELALTLAADDLYPGDADPGLQIDILVTVKDIPFGTKAELWIDKALQKPTVNIPADQFTFSKVTLTHAVAPSCHVMEVRIFKVVSAFKTVCADTGMCGVTIEPTSEACLTADADPATPGLQLEVTVTSNGTDCDRAWVDGDVPATDPVDLVDGSATFSISLTDQDGPINCLDALVVAHVTDSKAPEREESLEISYSADTQPPALTIDLPTKSSLSLVDDEDGDPANGVQATVAGTAVGGGPEDAIELWVNQQLVDTTVALDGEFAFDNVTFPQTGLYSVEVRSEDCCLQQGQATRNILVVLGYADVVILSPMDGTCLDATKDGNPATAKVFETLLLVQAPTLTAGDIITIECRPNLGGTAWSNVVGFSVPEVAADFNYTVDVALDTVKLTQNVLCRASINKGGLKVSPVVGITAAIPAPTLVIEEPTAGALVDPQAVPVSGSATGLDGQTVTLSLLSGNNPLAQAEAVVAKGLFSATLGPLALPDDLYTLRAEASDSLCNVIAGPSAPSVDVVVDSQPPTLVYVTPQDGDVCTPPACADAVDVIPGHQIEVALEVLGEPMPESSEVCLSVNGYDQLPCVSPAEEGGAWIARFYGVTLLSGNNLFVASATDSLGHSVDNVVANVLFDVTTPRVTFTLPAQDVVVGAEPVHASLLVTKPDLAGAIEDATVAIFLDGNEVGTLPAGEGGVYEFDVTGFTPDATSILQASATTGDGTGWSDVRRVTFKTTAPAVALDGITDGQVFNLASAACAKGTAGCKLTVNATTANVETLATGKLTVDCGSGPVEKTSKVYSNKLQFVGVLLSDNASCTLVVSVTDLAGQTASGTPVSVTVDRTAPVIPKFDKPAYAALPKVLDEDPAAAGFQYTVVVVVGGLEAGASVSLDITPPGTQLSQSLAEAVADGKTVKVTFPQQTFDQGLYSLTASVLDAAGNQATLSKDVQFYLEDVDVRFDSANYLPEDPCTSDAQCAPAGICVPGPGGKHCMLPWKLSPQTLPFWTSPAALFDGTDNVRLCSSSTGLAGKAPLCATDDGETNYVVQTMSHLGGYDTLALLQSQVQALPQGVHHMLIEARRSDTGEWFPSTASTYFFGKTRYVFVDTTPPTVAAPAFPQDTLPPLGVLSAAELAPGASAQVSVTVAGAEGGSVSFTANGADKGSVAVAGATVSTTFKLSPGVNAVCATAKDQAGNASEKACANVTVDTEAPTLVFTYPDYSPLLAGSSANATLLSNLVGGTVHIERLSGGNWSETGTAVVGPAGSAVVANALAEDGSYELRAWIQDAALNKTTTVTSPAVILVDRNAPVVSIQAPADQKQYQPAEDLNGPDSGFQVEVSFTAAGADGWKIESQRCPDAQYLGCEDWVDKTPGPADITDLGNGAFKARIVFGKQLNPVEYRIVRVSAWDASGNQAAASVTVSVVVGSCSAEFLDLPETDYVNNSYCAVPGQDCAAADVPITVAFGGGCGAVDQVVLFVNDLPAATTADVADGTAEFSMSVSHGDAVQVEARLYSLGAETGSGTPVRLLDVDLQDPVPVLTTPAADPFLCNAASDLNAGSDGCQFNATGTVTGDNLVGGSAMLLRTDGNLEVVVASQVMNAEPFNAAFNLATIPEGTGKKLLLRATDAAGNTADDSIGTNVDVTPPGAVSLNDLSPSSDVNRRRPWVRLSWLAVSDNAGDEASGPATGYEFRYSPSPITNAAEFDAACDPLDVAGTKEPPLPAAFGTSQTYEISGPDARSPTDACRFTMGATASKTWHFAARAVDELGNVSQVSETDTVSTADLALKYASVARGTFGLGMGSYVFPLSDINGDNLAEYAVGGDSTYYGFCIVRGHANPPATITLSDAANANVHCLGDAFNSMQGYFVIGLGDVNGDGFRDVASSVYADDKGTYLTEYRIHMGNASGFVGDTPRLKIILGGGFYSLSGIFYAGNFNGDTGGAGKPLNDILVSYPEQNRVFIIPGNVAWTAGQPTTTIDLTKAADLTTWKVQVIQGLSFPANAEFGNPANGVGNVLLDGNGSGTQYDDIAIARKKGPGAVYVVKGRATGASTVFTLSEGMTGAGTEDDAAVKLIPEGPTASADWFGATIDGRKDVSGDGVPDILLSHPYYTLYTSSTHYLFFSEAMNAAVGTSLKLGVVISAGGYLVDKGPGGLRLQGNFFNGALLGNFDFSTGVQTASVDLVYGDFNGQSTWGSVYVRFNLSGLSLDGNLFPYQDLVIKNPFDPASIKFGNSKLAAVGDVNGDSMPDLLIPTDSSGYAVLAY